MGFMQFVKNYGKVKADNSADTLMKGIVALDLDGAAEADIRVLEENLDKLVKAATAQAAEATRERREADEINELYNNKLAAIEILNEQLADAEGADAEELEEVILEEVEALESMQNDIARENEEAEEAETYQKELDEMCMEASKALKNARGQLNKAKTNLKRAERNTEREERKAAQRKNLKGLTAGTGKLATALEAMQEKTEDERQKSEGLAMKSKLLGDDDKKNARMEAAMAKAAGKTSTADMSVKDRLAALKKK